MASGRRPSGEGESFVWQFLQSKGSKPTDQDVSLPPIRISEADAFLPFGYHLLISSPMNVPLTHPQGRRQGLAHALRAAFIQTPRGAASLSASKRTGVHPGWGGWICVSLTNSPPFSHKSTPHHAINTTTTGKFFLERPHRSLSAASAALRGPPATSHTIR